MRIIGNRGNTARKVQAVASGTLASGGTVVVNADGTVSVIAGVAAGVGSATVFEAASTSLDVDSSVFDSNSNKVVIVYADNGNSTYGTAVVGTVSGASISFGTPVVFASVNASQISTTFDSNLNKVVIAYRNNSSSSKGTCVIGTVSGTGISFGTPVVFASGIANGTNACFDSNSNKVVICTRLLSPSQGIAIIGTVSGTSISFGTAVVFNSSDTNRFDAVFDTSNNKVVIAYRDVGNSGYGTAIVGTVSGSSISFGSEVVFNSGDTQDIDSIFDSNSSKIVLAYRDGGNSNYGTGIVASVSGTSISFGTEVVFTASRANTPSISFDSNINQVVIAYRDVGNSNYGTLVQGKVSGTSISFDTPLVCTPGLALALPTSFDSNSNKTVIAYNDGTSSPAYYGTALVYTAGSTNLTSENFIGIASNGYGDTKTATINVKGFIDDNQSGLTAGQSYYVRSDGTLNTAAGDPSVFAGTAVSATKLIVKG